MRIYTNCLEMHSETERELFEFGVRYQSMTVQDQQVGDDPGYETMELINYGYQLTKAEDTLDLLEKCKISTDWAMVELEERIDLSLVNKNPGSAYNLRSALWDAFLHNGVFAYTYAERWQEQIPYVVKELMLRPNSRQVIMTMYDRHQDMMNWGGQARVPCSLSYHFMLRNGKLNMLYHQRSCDFMKFFAADVFFSVSLMNHIAALTGQRPGVFTHMIGSLHMFKKDVREGIF